MCFPGVKTPNGWNYRLENEPDVIKKTPITQPKKNEVRPL
jgi:hypothetical protein